MLRLRLDYLPCGRVVDTALLGELTIVNDLTGTSGRGNYVVELRTDRELRRDRVEGFDRNEGAWALVHRALSVLGVEP